MSEIHIIGIALLGVILGILIGFFARKKIVESRVESIEKYSKKILAEAQKEARTTKKEAALQAKDTLYQMKIEFETLRQTTRRDLDDRATAKEQAISLFNANSEALYDAPGNLIIEVGKNGYQFEVEIQRTGATRFGQLRQSVIEISPAKGAHIVKQQG